MVCCRPARVAASAWRRAGKGPQGPGQVLGAEEPSSGVADWVAGQRRPGFKSSCPPAGSQLINYTPAAFAASLPTNALGPPLQKAHVRTRTHTYTCAPRSPWRAPSPVPLFSSHCAPPLTLSWPQPAPTAPADPQRPPLRPHPSDSPVTQWGTQLFSLLSVLDHHPDSCLCVYQEQGTGGSWDPGRHHGLEGLLQRLMGLPPSPRPVQLLSLGELCGLPVPSVLLHLGALFPARRSSLPPGEVCVYPVLSGPVRPPTVL